MARFANSVQFNPAAGGTVDFVVSAAMQGFMTPAQAGAVDGGLYKYRAESNDLSQWEVGEGTYTAGTTTLSRTTVLQNSSGTTAKINFTNPPNVGIVALKQDLIAVDEANSFTAAQAVQARANIGASGAFGQCKFKYVSATQCALAPFNGADIKINGQVYQIPAAGVTITNAGLTASTLYYAYVYMNAGVMTLEFSTTAHATSSTAGNVGTEIKNGDDTRSLVGMVFVNSSSQFVDASNSRQVRSWFNDTGTSAYGQSTTRISTSATTLIELEAAVRSGALVWAGEKFDVTVIAECWNSTASATLYASCWLAGSTWFGLAPRSQTIGTGGNWWDIPCFWSDVAASDGMTIWGIGGATTSGTINYDNKLTRIQTKRN